MKNYDDIIDMEHFHAPGKPHMENFARAAQFMPFKSLSTHEGSIEEKTNELNNADWEVVDPEYDIIDEVDF